MRAVRLAACLALAAALAAGPAAAAEKKRTGGTTYLQVNTLLGTMIRASGARGVLAVDCGLDIQDPNLYKLADQSLPRLRAAYVQIVQSYAAGLSQGTLPNAEYLATRLQRETDVQLGRPGAKLLLGAIITN